VKVSTSLGLCLFACLALGLIGLLWTINRHHLWERWETFQRMPVFGKSWANEVDKMQHLYPKDSVDILFLGDSHMEQCEWQEFFRDKKVANRGIGGETTSGLLVRIEALPQARIVFLQIGINDLLSGQSPAVVAKRYQEILALFGKKGSRVIPTLVFYTRYSPDVNPAVTQLNQLLMGQFQAAGLEYLSLNDKIAEDEKLHQAYSLDGIHLNAAGYDLWVSRLKSVWLPVPGSR
jgi:lysophospholipase L1-like esterase